MRRAIPFPRMADRERADRARP